jgi:hypothetical protein
MYQRRSAYIIKHPIDPHYTVRVFNHKIHTLKTTRHILGFTVVCYYDLID